MGFACRNCPMSKIFEVTKIVTYESKYEYKFVTYTFPCSAPKAAAVFVRYKICMQK